MICLSVSGKDAAPQRHNHGKNHVCHARAASMPPGGGKSECTSAFSPMAIARKHEKRERLHKDGAVPLSVYTLNNKIFFFLNGLGLYLPSTMRSIAIARAEAVTKRPTAIAINVNVVIIVILSFCYPCFFLPVQKYGKISICARNRDHEIPFPSLFLIFVNYSPAPCLPKDSATPPPPFRNRGKGLAGKGNAGIGKGKTRSAMEKMRKMQRNQAIRIQ